MRILYILCLVLLVGCKKERFEDKFNWHTIKVTASAYNSTKSQTDGSPFLTAYGDSLKPGLHCIAVSKDLIKKGLTHNTPVKIEGFDSIYFVKDRMHPRWRNKIDIYMGLDVKSAKKWGLKKVKIQYGILKDSLLQDK